MQTHTHTQTPTGCTEILEVMASFICLIVGMVLSIYVCLLSCFSRVWLFATPWLSLWGSSVRGDSPDKNTGMGCYALLQGIFPDQESNPGLQHYWLILYHLSQQGSPYKEVHWLLHGTFPIQGLNPGLPNCRLFTSWGVREAQEYWREQPIPSPEDLPDPGIQPGSSALQVDSLPAELPGKP